MARYMEHSYLVLKSIHIFGVILLMGNIIVTAWWKFMADKTKDPSVISFAQRQVTLTDFVFTFPGALLAITAGDSMAYNFMADTWDIQWNFCCLINHGVCLTPSVNLISNIGVFGTHGAGITDSHFMKTYDIDINNVLNYNPTALLVNYAYDAKLHKNKSWKIVLIRDILNIFKKIHLYFFARALYRIIKRIP